MGLRLIVTRHHLLEVRCGCGHVSRARPWRAADEALWENVTPGQWRLIGPQWAGLIVLMSLRMRLSRQRIQALLETLFALQVSTGLIDQTIREAGRLSQPLEDELVADLHEAAQLHVDETPWPESGVMLWLWVRVSARTVLYLIRPRSREMLGNALAASFAGVLMSDGYTVYRDRPNHRLRCWAHLAPQVRGLAESTDRRAAKLGTEMAGILKRLQAAVYAARGASPPAPPSQCHADDIARLRRLCERHRDDTHSVVGSLAREFLNDWDVILRPLDQPHLPLSNNAAEQALRHWVVARRISHGTRSATGSRALALLAGVIDTGRRRGGLRLALPRDRHSRRTPGSRTAVLAGGCGIGG